ncbi:hypothetical protein [[Clostridium] polysaccharolyticum]|uniref:Uncharacterized protein n=1 Tax=[Clostridium] polysaccharolyticum TaxID=29364 RepID=A0A1I0ELR7_9FIRM|nr:hypothetical protein [[Clostridium] polysaccharolyticum]SET45917.1 hypothetical protein SAMN04487772_12235 [[Clostridium] polysaccharolyticum]
MSMKNKEKVLFLVLTVCLLSGCGMVKEKTEATEAEHKEAVIKKAISSIEEKKYPQAIGMLSKIKDDKKAEDLLQQLRYLISGTYLANLDIGVAAIDNSGKVKTAVDTTIYKEPIYSECSDWNNIISLSCAFERLDGLDKEGNVYSTNDPDPAYIYVIEKLKSYKDIVAISTDFDNYVLLSKTGKIEAFSQKYGEALNYFKKEISTWTDVVKVVTGQRRIAALKRDGTVYIADYNKYYGVDGTVDDEVNDWTDIVDIADVFGGPIVGLKSDGTVICSKEEIKGPDGNLVKNPHAFHVSGWNDIIAISQSGYSLLGLKRDGSVVATGGNAHKQLDVSGWHDIVAIAAGDWISVGLKSDGTVVIAGDCGKLDPKDVANMNDLYVPTVKY